MRISLKRFFSRSSEPIELFPGQKIILRTGLFRHTTFKALTEVEAKIKQETANAMAHIGQDIGKEFMGLGSIVDDGVAFSTVEKLVPANSLSELVTAMDEADQQPPFNEHQAKLDIINKRLGA